MACSAFGLVDIVRDYLVADTLTRRLFARFRAGELRFDEVQALVGDDEDSVLYRLKEHCHALFRPHEGTPGVVTPREALFDLAVGSLFHEAMKFRENLYQHAVYGPKVRALRSGAGADAAEIFREFEKILGAARVRLDEALLETEALLTHTRVQFRVLLVEHRDNGLVARFLIENAARVGEVFPGGLESLLDAIHERAAEGFATAARSYLGSGYFAEASGARAAALARGSTDASLPRLAAYAEGMEDYLHGRYADALVRLDRWLALGPGEGEGPLADLAYTALSRLGAVAEGPDAAELAARAGRLAVRAGNHSSRARLGRSMD